ncbi:hypothetical protein A0130_10935 [Leifsonia xyli]|uniref:C40 family peptidase n=1 Tax=Leifsonia xyli TaxID=1575 RepID=UPI0007CDED14|nr:hypothetical protein A0130_10935 [Leifsonia xyli]
MTVTDAIGRIAQIQATLVQLDGGKTSATSSSTSAPAVSSTSATDFASALSGALDSPATGTVTGADVVADAKKYLGVPYVFGGTSASGLDCSGLVQRVFKDLGIDVPRLVSGQSKVGTEIPSLAQAQPGDIIVTNGGEHIVIYAGDGKVIHAPSEGRNVSLVDNWMSDSDIVTIRRLVPQAAPATSSPLSPYASALSGLGGSTSSAQADMLRSLFASLAQGGSL